MNEPAPRRRGRRVLLALLAAALLLVLFAALAPTLLAGFAAGRVEAWFAEQHRGALEIGELDLAWTRRQRARGVRLLDPEGHPVLRVDAELPSLGSLARGAGRRIGRVALSGEVELVADEQGVTNLDRALEPEQPPAPRAERGEQPEDGAGWRERLAALDLELTVDLERVAWSDPRTRALGGAFELRDLGVRVVARPGEALALDVQGRVVPPGEEPGALELHARTDLARIAASDPGAVPLELDARVDGFPAALVDSLAGQPGLLVAALGPTFTLRARGEGTLEGGELDVEVAGAHGRVVVDARLVDGVLRSGGGAALRASLAPPAAALERLLPGAAELELRRADADAPLELAVLELALPLAPLLADGDPLPELLAGLRLSLRGELGSWSARLPVEGGAPRTVELREATLALRVAGAGAATALELDLRASLGGEAAGRVELQARVQDLAAAAAEGAAHRGFAASAALEGLPLALLDALSGAAEPFAQRALGESLDLRLQAEGGLEQGRVALRATTRAGGAEVASVDAALRAEDGVVVGGGEPALALRWSPPPGADALVQGFAPAGARLGAPRAVSASVSELRVPLREALASDDPAAALLDGSQLALRAELRGLEYATADGTAVALERLELQARRDPELGARSLRADLAGQLAGGGSLTGRMRAADLAQLADLAERRELGRLDFELRGRELPTSLLRSLAGGGETLAGLGPAVALDLEGELELPAGGPLRGRIALALDQATRVDGTFSASDPFALEEGDLPEVEAQLEARGLEPLVALAPPRIATLAAELLGGALDLRARTSRAGGATAVALDLEAQRVDLALTGTLREGTFSLGGERGFELLLRPTPALLDAWVGPSLPEGARLALAQPDAALRARLPELSLPLDPWLAADGDAPADLAGVVRRASASASLDLPGLVYTEPGAGAQPVRVELRDLRVELALAARGPLRAEVSGTVAGERAGKIDLQLDVEDPAALLAEGAAPEAARVRVQGLAEGVPTALIDALAQQEGLLVDVLGATLEARVRGAWAEGDPEPLRAELRSEQASLALEATLDERVLRASGQQQGLLASLPLTPLFSERVVGQLVPMLFQLSKPEDAAPVGLQVTAFALPLDGDLRALDASVELNLGTVAYQLLPGLQQVLQAGGLEGTQERLAEVDPVRVRIEKGVARYQHLAIPVAGEKLAFRGSFDLVESRFDLVADVPLALLGSKVERELDKVRELLPADTRVPIELKGTPKSPRVTIGKEFLDTIVKQAAEGALRKGLEDLLGGKKKKD